MWFHRIQTETLLDYAVAYSYNTPSIYSLKIRSIRAIRVPYLILHYFYPMNLEWLKTGIGPLKELIAFLNKEGKTNDVLKKQVIRELRNNLNIFHNGFMNNVSQDTMIDMLNNDMIKEAIKENFKFKKLKPGRIEPYHVFDERNKKYTGWDAEKLIDKIDEKIEELKNIKKMNGGSVSNVKNNLSLMLSNLYYRMKLLADFIRSDIK